MLLLKVARLAMSVAALLVFAYLVAFAVGLYTALDCATALAEYPYETSVQLRDGDK